MMLSRVQARSPLASCIGLSALVVAVLTAYWAGLGGSFVFDDYPNLLDNPALRVQTLKVSDWLAAALSSPASSLQRPLAMFSFTLNYYFTGYDAWAMKFTNLALHAINALLVFALVRALQRSATTKPIQGTERALAWFLAFAWALHPLHVTAVLYVVQRMEVLAHLFVFAGLWCYVHGRSNLLEGKRGWGWIGLGVLGGSAIGLLSKESALLLPLYALIVEAGVFRFRARNGRRERHLATLYVWLLLFPLLAGFAWLSPSVLDPTAFAGRDFTLSDRLLTEARVVVDYLRWTVFPDVRVLGLYHDDYAISRSLLGAPTPLPAIALLIALAGSAWWIRNRRPLVAVGMCWFLAAHTMTATVLPLELVFEHRNYFASLGIVLAVGDLLLCSGLARRLPVLTRTLGVAFVVFCAATTAMRANEWNSLLRFARSEALKHPRSARANYEYARALIIISNYDPKSPLRPEILRTLEAAGRIPGGSTLPEQAALIYAARIHAPSDPSAWDALRAKLRVRSGGPQEQLSLIALTNCAAQKLCDFPPQEMLETFEASLAKEPHAGTLTIYGNYAVQVLDDRPLALRLFREAAAMEPGNPQFQINLIKFATSMGNFEEARRHIAVLRNAGRLGQYGPVADALERQIPQQQTRNGAEACGRDHCQSRIMPR
jgi:hypothetical protein